MHVKYVCSFLQFMKYQEEKTTFIGCRFVIGLMVDRKTEYGDTRQNNRIVYRN